MTALEGKRSNIAPYPQSAPFAVPLAHDQFQRPSYPVGLRDIWVFLRRRMRLISSVVFGCTFLSIVAFLSVTKIYTATSTIVLERKDVRPFETDAATYSLERDRSAAETEMDVLRSRQFAGRIVDHLNLASDPAFNPYAASKEDSSGSVTSTTGLFERLGLGRGESSEKAPSADVQRNRAISTLLSHIRVNRRGESLAVNIVISDPDPKMAAQIANAVADLYVESSLEFKQDVRLADKQRARTTGGAVGFLRERVAQPLLITLRSEEARLARERAELESRYGKNHPKVVDKVSQIASVRKMIDEEVQRILQDLEIEALKPSARIVSLAEVPTSPSFPKLLLFIPGAIAASSLLAILLALILEATDTRIRNGDRISQNLQVLNLGYVPRIRNRRKVHKNVAPLLEEALHPVYLSCHGPNLDKPYNVIMVTACLPDGSSAATARGIAAAGAADGRKVLYVDLNFARSGSRNVGPSEAVARYMTDETSLAALINEAPTTAGQDLRDAPSQLNEIFRTDNSKNLPGLLKTLGRIGYNFIVLHAPPVFALGGSTWISPLVDGVIVTVLWAKTTEEQLSDAIYQLRLSQARLIGTVIDGVDPLIQSRHGYGGPLKYYREAQRHS